MPKTLEILIGDVKKVSQELAERTVKEIEEARANGYELKSLEDSKKHAQKHLNELKGMGCHEFNEKYGQYDWDDASDAYLTAKQNMRIEWAKEDLEKIREKIKKVTRPYVMVCAKGSSAVSYYEALKEIENNGFCFTSVRAFCIDEDLNATTGYEFVKNNLPKGISVEGLRAKFSYDGKIVDKDLLSQIIAANPSIYSHRGREIAIQPQNAIRSLSYGINKVCTGYEDKIASSGGIDTAIIGMGVDPLHIGSNFPPAEEESRTHLAEKADADGNIIGYTMTMGIATLCSAKKAVLFASGEKKADGVKEFLECTIGENCPPSYLRNMNNLIVALDQGAASRLDFGKLKEMYKDRELVIKNV